MKSIFKIRFDCVFFTVSLRLIFLLYMSIYVPYNIEIGAKILVALLKVHPWVVRAAITDWPNNGNGY